MTAQEKRKTLNEIELVENSRLEHIEPAYLSGEDLFVISGPFFQARIVTKQGLIDMGFESHLTSGTN